jgi:hypothetical protein
MLAALKQGMNGGKWSRLFYTVFSECNLEASYLQMASNGGAAGIDHVSTDDSGKKLPQALRK